MFSSSFLFKKSSSQWIQTQATDRYVRSAARDGYIARSAYKIAQIDDRFKIFSKKQKMVVVDLGAAPGGWSQVARRRCSDDSLIIGVDRSPLATALVGYRFVQGDFTDPEILKKLNSTLEMQRVSGKVDVIMSDMCPDRSGGSGDCFALADLDFKVLLFARKELKTDGHLVMKMIGGANYYEEVLQVARRNFAEVKINKPDSSRASSDETFLVALSKLEEPRSASIVFGGGHSVKKRPTDSRGSVRAANKKSGHERFVSHGLDDWPGLTKFKMRGRTANPRPNIYKWWRKFNDSVKNIQKVDERPPPEQPFGPEFGLTIFPEFLDFTDCQNIRQQYVDMYLRERSHDSESAYESAQQSDGRLSLPPLHPSSFGSIVRKLEEEQIVLPNYLNNQTINLYQPGDFIRAHVDNLFVYDETFAILSVGSPALLKMTHIQNGEELECVIPERSVYIMEGPSRYVYFHAVLPVEDQRLSIVLRRCPFRTSATFAPVHKECEGMLQYKGNAISTVLMQKEIGCTRINLTDEWMEEQRLGSFDTGEMVKRLRPLRDWSLKQQLDEDYLRYDELKRMNALLGVDLEWRFDELRKKFKEVETEITLNQEALAQKAKEKKPVVEGMASN